MRIEDVDKNFKIEGGLNDDGLARYDVSKPPFSLHGVFFDKERGFLRAPEQIVDGLKVDLMHLLNDSSGGRVKFSTNSSKIEVRARYKRFFDIPHMPRTGHSGFSLIEETDGDYKHVRNFIMPFSEDNLPDKWAFEPSADCTVELCSSCVLKGDKMRDYTLYMPTYCGVQSLEIALDEKAELSSGRLYKPNKTVVYYGSSITQGGCASRPDLSYQNFISKWTNTDYVNFGFAGNAKGQQQIVEHIASVDCNVFVCDYDHNEENANTLKEKHYALYKTYRAKRPKTPIIFLSLPDFDRVSGTRERMQVIKDTVKKAKSEGDKNVYFINGKLMMGKTPSEREVCSVDGIHPNDLGFYRMALAIKKVLSKIDRAYK